MNQIYEQNYKIKKRNIDNKKNNIIRKLKKQEMTISRLIILVIFPDEFHKIKGDNNIHI